MRKMAFIACCVLLVVNLSRIVGQDCSGIRAGTLLTEDTTRCMNEETLLTLNGSNGGLLWQYRPHGMGAWFTLGVEYNNDTIISVKPSQDFDYRVVVNNGFNNCDTSNVVTIYVSEILTQIHGGKGFTDCSLTFDPYARSSGQPIEYWKKVSGSGNVTFYPDSSVADLDSMVVDQTGEYHITWNISDGICTLDSSHVFIATERPRAFAGNDTNHCGLSLNLFARLSSAQNTGEWKGNSSFLSDPTDPKTLFKPNPNPNPGYQLIWEEDDGICKDTDTVVIKTSPQPQVTVGGGGFSCDTTYMLEASIDIVGATGEWSFISGPDANVRFGNFTEPNTLVYVKEYGEKYLLKWTGIWNFCSDSDTVEISFYEQPVAAAIANDDTCGNSAQLISRPSVGNGAWNYLSGATVAPLVQPENDSVAIVTIADGQYSNHVFEWKEVNGACRDSSEISFKFIEQPIANAGFGADSCGFNIEVNAHPSVGSGEWILTDSVGSLQFLQGRTSAHSVIRADSYGHYQLMWKEDNEGCADSSSAIMLNFFEQPKADAGINGDTCGFDYLLEVVQSVEGSSGYWEGNATFNQMDRQDWLAKVNAEGTYVFTWTETNGSCFDTSLVYVSFLEQPNAQILSSDTISCSLESSLIADITNASGTWLVEPGPGELAMSPDNTNNQIDVFASEYGRYLLKWVVTNQKCVASDSIFLSFIENPVANAGPDQTLDNVFETTMEAVLPSTFIGEWLLVEGEGILSNPSAPESSVYNLALGKNMFSWTVANGDCISIDTVSISIFDIFIPDVITPNGDGDNDYFEIKGIENINNVELTVFNRWGGEVHTSLNYQNDWDGTGKSGEYLTNDTYFYVVNIENGARVFKGFVMINK